jgi:hypothetical protein
VLTGEGVVYELDFVKIAVNVARRSGEASNALPELLRAWFGAEAGHPGTAHRVQLSKDPGGRWQLRPLLGGEPVAPGAVAAGD